MAILIEAKDDRELELKTNDSFFRIINLMNKKNLHLAPEITKIIIFKVPRKKNHFKKKERKENG